MPLTTASRDSLPSNTFGRRAGATWVAATGAALVLVAAAVLVASQWDRLSDAFKLGLLATATGFCSWAGHRLRTTLPATGSVVFHLGLLLVPANLAAVAVHLDASLGQHLLAQGVVGAVLFTAAAAATHSVVFRWASIASVPLIAAGVGALMPIPAFAVLVAFAAVAEWSPRLIAREAVVVWAGLGGLGAVIVSAALFVVPGGDGAEFVTALGLDGTASAWATGLAAAAVLAWRAERDRSLSVAGLAIVSAVLAAVVAGFESQLNLEEGVLGAASAFVLVETLALLVRSDRFWNRPLAAFAAVCEIPTWVVSMLGGAGFLGLVAVDADFFLNGRDVTVAAACFVAAAGWLVAHLRRTPLAGFAIAALGVLVPVGVVLATASPTAGGVTVALCVVGLAVARRLPLLFGLGAGPLAIGLASQDHPVVALTAGLAVAGALMVQSLQETRRGEPGRPAGLILTCGASGTALLALWVAIPNPFVWAVVAVAVIAVTAALAETASHDLANVARAWFVIPLASLDADPRHLFFVAGAVTLALVIDGLRLQRPVLVGIGAGAAQFTIVGACRDSGLSVAETGIALAFFAVVLSGVAAIVDGIWQRPLLTAAGAAALVGLYAAAGDPQALAITLVVLGALGVAAGLTIANHAIASVGGIAIVVGVMIQLAIADVRGVEFHVLPAAVYLIVVGEFVRRRGPVSSWLSAAPGPALFASVALLERMTGGGAVHALAAAVAAGGAVALGGARRQSGPLLSGTAILAVLAANESMSALAGMPAWGWIGIVGASLIAVAVMIERTDTSPVDVGRRLVDVISDSFE